MKLLKVDNVNDELSMVYDAWDELITVLNRVWPDMDDDDWDNVKLNELVPAILQILKTSFKIKSESGDDCYMKYYSHLNIIFARNFQWPDVEEMPFCQSY